MLRATAILPNATLICCLVSCAALATAQDSGTDAPRDATLAPYFQVLTAVDPGVDALPLKDTQVDATVAGVIADVSVVQTYTNEGSVPLDARYVFPGSTRAAVHGLTMVLGDRVVRARIETKGKARATYEAARREGKSSALLEQHRPNVFEMNLANILPGDVVRVELRYTELLVPEAGEYQFVFPTVVGPRYVSDTRELHDETSAEGRRPGSGAWTSTPSAAPAPLQAATFGLALHLAAGVPIAHLVCDSHPVRIEAPTPDRATLVLHPAADPSAHADRDVIVRYRLSGDATHAGLLTTAPAAGRDGYFLAMIQPPARLSPVLIPPRDYVFIVDVSGSMHGFPLDTARDLLTELVGSLRATDTFNLVLFAGSAATLAPAPLPATPENLARAIVLLERQPAGGGTELLPALETGFALPRPDGPLARTFVIVTDGYVTVEAEAFALVRQRLDAANVFAFGIGSSVNRHLIEGLARAGQGEPFIVAAAEEARETARRFREYIESPLLTQVSLAAEGVQIEEMVPGAIPDLFAQRPVVVFGKWSGTPAGRLRITAMGGAGPFESMLDFSSATPLESSRALELLWARSRIRALEDDQLEGNAAERVTAITRLGLEHGLLTSHTSFVAVDERVRRSGGDATPVQQPTPVPAGLESSAMGGHAVATTPEPASLSVLALALIALAGAAWRARRRIVREAA